MTISLYDLFRTPIQVRILEVLLSNPDEYFTVNRMAKKLNVSPSSVSSRLNHLKKLGLIKVISRDKAKVFSLNRENELTKLLLNFFNQLINNKENKARKSELEVKAIASS